MPKTSLCIYEFLDKQSSSDGDETDTVKENFEFEVV